MLVYYFVVIEMPEKTTARIPMGATPVLGTILGVFIGWYLNSVLHTEMSKTSGYAPLFTSGNFNLWTHEIIVIVIGFLLMMFGGRIHRIVKFMGLGIVASEVGFKLFEASGKAE